MKTHKILKRVFALIISTVVLASAVLGSFAYDDSCNTCVDVSKIPVNLSTVETQPRFALKYYYGDDDVFTVSGIPFLYDSKQEYPSGNIGNICSKDWTYALCDRYATETACYVFYSDDPINGYYPCFYIDTCSKTASSMYIEAFPVYQYGSNQGANMNYYLCFNGQGVYDFQATLRFALDSSLTKFADYTLITTYHVVVTEKSDNGDYYYNLGFNDGYSSGHADGVAKVDQFNFYNFISTLFSAPFTFISSALDFDVFGINMATAVKVLITMLIVFAIVFFIVKLIV